MKTRIDKFRKNLANKGIDAGIISSPYNIYYLSGFWGSAGNLYISEDELILLTDSRYTSQARQQAPDYEIIDITSMGFYKKIKEIIGVKKKIAFEDDKISHAEYLKMSESLSDNSLIAIDDMLDRQRWIKDEKEVELLRKASKIGDDAFTHMLNFIKVGMTEKEIAIELEFTMKKLGADGLSFDSIIASGLNGALPHARPTDKVIKEGELLTMDFGCIYKRYCSDMTRTIAIGQVDNKLKEIYEITLKAHLEAAKKLGPNLKGRDVDEVARDIIKEAGYGEYFGHGLGHAVGLEVHEEPRLSPKGHEILKENMFVTIEPGIYIPGVGGVRIEDLFVITENGCQSLVESEKKLISI